MVDNKVLGQNSGENWAMYHGDCVEVMKGIPENSIDFCVHSPPFAQLYIYSDSEADMGNCSDNEEFFQHYRYAIDELFRVTVKGRLCAVHCKDLPKYANVWGTTGLIDFPGACIQEFEDAGWVFHSRITIWKCPVIERERTNNNGLLHKTVKRDTSQVRQGMADYLLIFRKPPESGTLLSDKPIVRPRGFDRYIGECDPRQGIKPKQEGYHQAENDNQQHPSKFSRKPPNDGSIAIWQRYADPVWWDINQTNVLNFKQSKRGDDRMHICLAKDSLVLTKDKGHIPIQDIELGDLVLTHIGRWRPVIAKACTGVNPVVKLNAQGVHELTLTPNHKVWARNPSRTWRRRQAAMTTEPEWIESQKLEGAYVNLKLPPAEENQESELFWWIVGRWIADGHIDQRNVAHISVGVSKKEDFLNKVGDIAGNPQFSTAFQFPLKDPGKKLRSMFEKCGKLAHGKHLPPEAFTLSQSLAKALLDGYLSGDGHYREDRKRWYVSSVSKELLIGLQFLVQRVTGDVATLHAGREPVTTTIEGREVNTRQDWIMSWGGKGASFSFTLPDGAWKKVKSVKPAGEAETWNLQVEEDSSYTADGCVVKNCPLQLDVIERAIHIWSDTGETVLSPFAGIGSEGVGALKLGRKFVGVELRKDWFEDACGYLSAIEAETKVPELALEFD